MRVLVCLLLMLSLAGCSSPNAEPVDETVPSDAVVDRDPIRHNASGALLVEALNVGIGDELGGSYSSTEFHLPSNVKTLVAEFRYDGPGSLYDFHLMSPAYCPESSIMEDTECFVGAQARQDQGGDHRAEGEPVTTGPVHLRIEIDASTMADETCGQRSCRWAAWGIPYAAVQSDWEFRATAFYGDIPDGFTAFYS